MDALDVVLRDLIDTLLGENVAGTADALETDVAGVPDVACAEGEWWCRIPVTGGALAFRCRDGGPLQPWRLSRAPVWLVGDAQRELAPAEVLDLLVARDDLPGYDVVAADLCTAVEHAEVTSAGWAALPEGTPRPGELLTGERLAATRNRPFHPTARAVSGWSAAELSEYGPMRQPPLALRWVAVRREQLRHGEGATSDRIAEVLLTRSEQGQLADELGASGVDPDEYQPVPVHPWQFDRVLRTEWAHEIAARDVVPLDCLLGWCHPTASLRTLATSPDAALHVKLPLGGSTSSVATLGAARLLPPRYLDNGDKAHRTLRWLLDTDPTLAERVALCDERAWCGWHASTAGEFADRPGELAAQVRRYPQDVFANDAIALPMAALAAHEWRHLAPALDVDDPAAFFRDIATAFCAMMFTFLGHGVLPELHGQNVVAVFPRGHVSTAARPSFVLRDHDTVRLCPRWMAVAGTPDPGYRIKPGAPQSLCLDEPEALIGYAQTLGLHVNLYGIADALARHYDLDERAFWLSLTDAVNTGIDAATVRDEVRDTLRTVLLDAPEWPSRQVLGPLLRAGRGNGVSMPAATGRMPNPLLPTAVRR
ncbi:IucA/IucC family protein [Haloechinothrix halophila]|uniref:IucA/IucC family protein n=1 Tax=Haloechinothrix halophila TaxID=1069073 RepID=UPI0003FCEA00|nr:IucA/IucC family protein [Haloechinothrix halophila]